MLVMGLQKGVDSFKTEFYCLNYKTFYNDTKGFVLKIVYSLMLIYKQTGKVIRFFIEEKEGSCITFFCDGKQIIEDYDYVKYLLATNKREEFMETLIEKLDITKKNKYELEF